LGRSAWPSWQCTRVYHENEKGIPTSNYRYMDGTDEGIKVSARKIRPSGISHKQGVPVEKAVADIQADGTGLMAVGIL